MTSNFSEPLYKHPDLFVAPCEFGQGVFTREPLPSNTTLEECHHLRLRSNECEGMLNDYVYGLEPDENDDVEYFSLPLGFGSIFNHADDHNTEYWHDVTRELIIFYTIKNVAAGEQLFINYGNNWWEERGIQPDS